MRVFSGNWALFSEPHFRGQRYDVRNGFTSLWMGVYSPEYGSADLRTLGRSLSSLKPLGKSSGGLGKQLSWFLGVGVRRHSYFLNWSRMQIAAG